MAMLKKIFPEKSKKSILDTFKLVFIAEGYLEHQEEKFRNDCQITLEKLFNNYPFSLSKKQESWISACTFFSPSKSFGPCVDATPNSGRTFLESTLDTNYNTLMVNTDILSQLINGKVLSSLYSRQDISSSRFVFSEQIKMTFDSTMFIILLPEYKWNEEGGKFRNVPSQSQYYYVALTQNGEWEKFIAGAIAFKIGLDIGGMYKPELFSDPNKRSIGIKGL